MNVKVCGEKYAEKMDRDDDTMASFNVTNPFWLMSAAVWAWSVYGDGDASSADCEEEIIESAAPAAAAADAARSHVTLFHRYLSTGRQNYAALCFWHCDRTHGFGSNSLWTSL